MLAGHAAQPAVLSGGREGECGVSVIGLDDTAHSVEGPVGEEEGAIADRDVAGGEGGGEGVASERRWGTEWIVRPRNDTRGL